MTNFTERFEKLLRENGVSLETALTNIFYDGMCEYVLEDIEFVDSFGECNDGATIEIVFKYKDEFYRFRGWYSSWSDMNWEDKPVKVYPQPVTRTYYKESK